MSSAGEKVAKAADSTASTAKSGAAKAKSASSGASKSASAKSNGSGSTASKAKAKAAGGAKTAAKKTASAAKSTSAKAKSAGTAAKKSSKSAAKSTSSTAAALAGNLANSALDDLEFVDGIGPKTAKSLQNAGVNNLSGLIAMTDAALEDAAQKAGTGGRPESENWKKQAKDILSGKPPQAKSDRAAWERAKKKLG